MKDVVHHLRHVQKKVIQFARKADNEERLASAKLAPSKTTASVALEASAPSPKRKRRLFNQLPQVARVH